jgi:hypothetical protein
MKNLYFEIKEVTLEWDDSIREWTKLLNFVENNINNSIIEISVIDNMDTENKEALNNILEEKIKLLINRNFDSKYRGKFEILRCISHPKRE